MNLKSPRIGSYQLDNPILAAPLAGLTDRAWRDILHRMGVGLCYTEMVSDKGLVYQDKKTASILDIEGEAAPVGVQLCGSDPATMAAAAVIIEEKAKSCANVAVLDINMGCPVRKIVSNGEGSSLMQRPEQAVELMRQVVAAVKLPVSAKLRLGWDDEHKNVVELAKALAAVGCQAVTIHGRTKTQMYSGQADWSLISAAAAVLPIPVFGNGDITSAQSACERLATSGCAAVMIGRGMLGNPWLIRDAVSMCKGEPKAAAPDLSEIVETAIWHLRREVELSGEYAGIRKMRSHLPWYVRGQRGAAALRGRINQMEKLTEIEFELRKFANSAQA